MSRIYQAPLVEPNFRLNYADLPANLKATFKGTVVRVKLQPGFLLWKLTGWGLRDGPLSPWWSSVASYREDTGLAARRGMARALGANLKDLMRTVAAVSEDWNNLNHLLQIRLTTTTYALWGQCASMPRVTPGAQPTAGVIARPKNSSINVAGITSEGGKAHVPRLVGTGWQFYMPNLTYPRDAAQVGYEPV